MFIIYVGYHEYAIDAYTVNKNKNRIELNKIKGEYLKRMQLQHANTI